MPEEVTGSGSGAVSPSGVEGTAPPSALTQVVQGTQTQVRCGSCREIIGRVYFASSGGYAQFNCKCRWGTEVLGTATGLVFRLFKQKG